MSHPFGSASSRVADKDLPSGLFNSLGAKIVDNDPSVFVRKSQSEFRLLQSGQFSDFTVVCGDREWKVHKAILSKVPYFNATVGGAFKEAIEEKTTITDFEPYEIHWLLSYIYFPRKRFNRAGFLCGPQKSPSLIIKKLRFLQSLTSAPLRIDLDPEFTRLDTASKSYLETCVRIWHLGDYFQIPSMLKLAEDKISTGCSRWRESSRTANTTIHGTSFMVDIESAIRQAWREDRASGPLQVQAQLVSLCLDFAPFIERHDTFWKLLEDSPPFAVTFSKGALGAITSRLQLPQTTGIFGVTTNRPANTPSLFSTSTFPAPNAPLTPRTLGGSS